MADVFISYARSSAATAEHAAAALRARGFSVWLDADLPAHRAYTHVIENELIRAKAAVVIWSAEAARSEWVLSEANRAREERKLVQLAVDRTRLPMPFDQIQCADLHGWSGDENAPGWRKVVDSVAALVRGEPAAAAAVAPSEAVLAVLPFDNLSGDPDMAYFSDGVSEEIQQTVARGSALKVIGRASSFQFRGPDKAAAHVGAQLSATHILDGSVRRQGDRVRIGAQLVDCRTETTLWSHRFDSSLTDIFALQDEIAAAVAEALETTFAPGPFSGPVDPVAHDLHLRARAIIGDFERSAECIRLLDAAVARSPGFADAWASLTMALAVEAHWTPDPHAYPEQRARVVEAADRASALDPGRGSGYAALSLLEPPGCYLRQEALIDKAMALSPNDPEILKQAADFVGSVGRTRERFRLTARAHALDPLNQVIAVNHCVALADIGRVDEAYEGFEVARLRWPQFEWVTTAALLISAQLGDWRVTDPLIEVARQQGGGAMRLAMPVVLAFKTRSDETADRLLHFAERQLAANGSVEFDLLTYIYGLGRCDEAFALLRRASFAHLFAPAGRPPSRLLTEILFGATTQALQRDPRFVELSGRLGICDYWVATDRWPDLAGDPDLPYDLKALAKAYVAANPASSSLETAATL